MTADPLATLRRICLALPEATERLSHGEPTWFVRDRKVFVTYADNHHDDRVAFWCAAPPGAQEALTSTAPERFFVPPYVGSRGWLGVRLDVEVDWEEIAEIVSDAYRAVAPRRLVQAMAPGAPGDALAPAPRDPAPAAALTPAPRPAPAAPDEFWAETPEQWRAWLAEHHATSAGVWLVTWKKSSGRQQLSYERSVEEALCFGWVDSRGGKVDAERTKLWFTPRRPTSGWARPNKQRVERLLADGRMTPAGLAAIEVAKHNGSWTLLDDVEDLVVPDDLATALAGWPGARQHWDGFPPSARRGMLEWIAQAKRPETRSRRVEQTAERAAAGERALG